MKKEMTSMERVLTTLSHQEPDRVPLFLLLTMHGAKELGLSLEEYFSNAEYLVEGQMRLNRKYQTDCLYAFFYASLELEAFGGETRFIEDGSPNAGVPIIRSFDRILSLEPPRVNDSPMLHRVLKAIEMLRVESKGETPIIGVVMSPFSLPVMQLGFERYLELMVRHRDLFDRLMQVNQVFCTEWANAQLAAGATAICYFDPVSSSTIVTRDLYLETGFRVAKETLAGIQGATATHFASGRCLPISDLVPQTGTAIVGVSTDESLTELKDAFRGKLSLLGNMNGVEMRRWTPATATEKVKEIIRQAAPGGGFILSDNHGEIPYQVPDEVLLAVSEAVRTYGKYPILHD